MNKWVGIGRLTKDPELKFTAVSGVEVTSFTLAVNRNFKNKEGQIEADFINIVAYRKLAEIISNNLKKGKLAAISGRIQTRTYETSDGQKRYITEIIADDMQFLEKKDASLKPTDEIPLGGEDFFPLDGENDIPF